MHIPWTTWTTACAILPVASAFYPYSPPPAGSSKSTPSRRDGSPNFRPRDASRRTLTLPLRRVALRARENEYDITESKDPGRDDSVAVDQDGSDISYMAAVRIGSSEEEYHLLLDSAASNTWVMGEECTSEACERHNTFGKGDSDSLETDTTPFSITYGTGSVSGSSAHDTLHIGPLSTPLTFGLATNVSQEFSSYPMDGILGLGKSDKASSLAAPQLIEALASANLIPKRLYGIHLSRAADGANDGELNLGALNEDLYDGEMNWVPALANDNGFWEVAVDDAGAGDEMAHFKSKSAIIDTGTSYMFLPSPDAATLHGLIPGSSQDGETFTVPCDTSAQLKLKFGGATYAVESKDWVGGTTDGGCRSNVFGRKTFGEDQWLLGDVFLKNVYAGFDFEDGKVGFGVKTSSPSSSGGEDGKASASGAQGTTSGESLGSSTVTSTIFTSISASVSTSVSTSIPTPSTPSDTSPPSTNQPSHSSPDSSPSATGTPTTSLGAFIPADASPTSPPSSQNVAVQSGGAEEGHTGGAGVLRVSMMGLMWGMVGMVVMV